MVDSTLVCVDTGAAAEELITGAAVEEAAVDAGAAVATQSQTAAAAVWTARPVTGPQAWTTQPRAAEAMAMDWEELHWQAKSVWSQPTPEPAEAIHEIYMAC